MKVVLVEDVEKLGHAGDVIVVKDGYARNFLIPGKKAREATAVNIKQAEFMKKKREEGIAKKKADMLVLADELSKLSVTVRMAAGEEDKLFGSVTAEMVQKELESNGHNIDKKHIIIEEPIKKLGLYQVEIKLHPEVKATLKVWVVKD